MKKQRFGQLFFMALGFAVFMSVSISEALARPGGFSSSRSFSSSRTYSAPRPAPRPAVKPAQRPVVVQKNVTHVHQTVNQSGGGGGFVSSMAGAFAGSAIGSWLFNDNKPAEVAPTQQLVPVDCSAEANKVLPICNAGAK